HWPDAPPASLGEIADRVGPPAAAAVAALNRSLYGADGAAFDATDAAAAIRTLASVGAAANAVRADDAIAPLTPN
ncbi:MAG: hypothetical protein AAFX58_13800, partial [Pseudomonadota bacterium]